MKISREHDQLYLKENRKLNPKEYFKFIAAYSKDFVEGCSKPRILDIGCATGDFLWYLSSLFPEADLTGMDVMPELLQRAQAEVPGAKFLQGNIFSGAGLPEAKYNAIYMSGVHSIFDECEPWINNVIHLLENGGRAFIFGIFNPEDVDVLVKARYSGVENPWQPGWNLFSKKTIGMVLEELQRKYHFTDFSLPIDMERHPEDPLRSWTFHLQSGSRMVVNGTQVIHHFSLLEIS